MLEVRSELSMAERREWEFFNAENALAQETKRAQRAIDARVLENLQKVIRGELSLAECMNWTHIDIYSESVIEFDDRIPTRTWTVEGIVTNDVDDPPEAALELEAIQWIEEIRKSDKIEERVLNLLAQYEKPDVIEGVEKNKNSNEIKDVNDIKVEDEYGEITDGVTPDELFQNMILFFFETRLRPPDGSPFETKQETCAYFSMFDDIYTVCMLLAASSIKGSNFFQPKPFKQAMALLQKMITNQKFPLEAARIMFTQSRIMCGMEPSHEKDLTPPFFNLKIKD